MPAPALLASLNRAAAAAAAAPRGLPWAPTLDPEACACMPEDLIALSAAPAWHALPAAARRRVGFFELLNLFSTSVHGEARLLAGLEPRAARAASPAALRVGLDHFAAEERAHTEMFTSFARRYATGLYPDRTVAFPERWPPGAEDFVFHARVVLFESVIDHYNVALARDAGLHPLVRAINRRHHLDEARHLALGRALVRAEWAARAPAWTAAARALLAAALHAFLVATWRDLANPHAWRDAGLADVFALRRGVLASPVTAARFAAVARRPLAFFRSLGLDLSAGAPADATSRPRFGGEAGPRHPGGQT